MSAYTYIKTITTLEDLKEGGYESETSSEESGQGDVSSNRNSSTNNKEPTGGEEEPRRGSTRVRGNRHLRQDYVY